MANHKSSIKRIRSNEAKNVRNKYQAKSTRSVIKSVKALTEKKDSAAELSKVSSMIDKLVKKNIIHKNKAGNLKSKLAKHINALK